MKAHCVRTLLVAATVGASACFGDEQWHIEQRQYQQEPSLTREIMLSTLSGTGPAFNFMSSSGEWRNQFI